MQAYLFHKLFSQDAPERSHWRGSGSFGPRHRRYAEPDPIAAGTSDRWVKRAAIPNAFLGVLVPGVSVTLMQ
jgi:hypothetical protein